MKPGDLWFVILVGAVSVFFDVSLFIDIFVHNEFIFHIFALTVLSSFIFILLLENYIEICKYEKEKKAESNHSDEQK